MVWNSIDKTVLFVTFLAQLIGMVVKEVFAVSWWFCGYETMIWVVLASTEPWWCRNFASND